jgi:hypothetical protein
LWLNNQTKHPLPAPICTILGWEYNYYRVVIHPAQLNTGSQTHKTWFTLAVYSFFG